MHQEFTCYDQPPIHLLSLYNRRATEGVPPLTGDGSQFDAPLNHTDPGPVLDVRPAPLPSGGRALAVVAALVFGLLTGFAAGFFAGREDDMISAPRSAASASAARPVAVPQPQSYTDAPVVEQQDAVRPTNEVELAPGASGEADKVRPTIPALGGPGSLQVASRPSGAQVYVDDVRVGVTPMSLTAVSAGVHRVRIELPGFRRWATSVSVESGARARVGASLER